MSNLVVMPRPAEAPRLATAALFACTLACSRPPAPTPPAPTPNPTATATAPTTTPPAPLTPLPLTLRRALDPTAFPPLPPPRPGSWRDRIDEPPQSFADFTTDDFPTPTPDRNTLVLLPLGSYPIDFIYEDDLMVAVRTPELHELRGFLHTYFGLPVDIVTPIPLEPLELPTRDHHGHRQYDAPALVDAITPALPEHAYAMVVLLNRDLYFMPQQAYGFGYGTHRDRLAVMSFARLDPARTGQLHGIAAEERIRQRAYKLLAHETAHTFGLRHCQQHACVMNGIADEIELDEIPLHLCAVCLHKLLHATGLDPVARYHALATWYDELSLEQEAAWVRARLHAIE
ncbi:MAG: archaemetzincin [Nannocystaceae bacterium]